MPCDSTSYTVNVPQQLSAFIAPARGFGCVKMNYARGATMPASGTTELCCPQSAIANIQAMFQSTIGRIYPDRGVPDDATVAAETCRKQSGGVYDHTTKDCYVPDASMPAGIDTSAAINTAGKVLVTDPPKPTVSILHLLIAAGVGGLIVYWLKK